MHLHHTGVHVEVEISRRYSLKYEYNVSACIKFLDYLGTPHVFLPVGQSQSQVVSESLTNAMSVAYH